MQIKPHRVAGAMFVLEVRDALLDMLMKRKREKKLKQADIARILEVDRSAVNRQFTGAAAMSLMRVGELADILGCTAEFRLVPIDSPDSNNVDAGAADAAAFVYSSSTQGGAFAQATETTMPQLEARAITPQTNAPLLVETR